MPFTSGEHKDANPTWSPDVGRLAFTSTRGTGEKMKASGHVAPVRTGGEPVTLTKLPEGAGSLAWSPDGRSIVGPTSDRPQHVYVVPADGSAPPAT